VPQAAFVVRRNVALELPMMVERPGGTVTLPFTGLEGWTQLLQRLGDCYAEALEDHRRLLRAAFRR
jgi:hypothetical protein